MTRMLGSQHSACGGKSGVSVGQFGGLDARAGKTLTSPLIASRQQHESSPAIDTNTRAYTLRRETEERFPPSAAGRDQGQQGL